MLILLFVLLIIFLILGVPVAFSIGGSALVVFLGSDRLHMISFITRMFNAVFSFPFLAVPFFILAGNIMTVGGITDRLLDLSIALVGHFKGGLAQVNIVASMLFSGVSGSALADTSAIGGILIPPMLKQGYSKEFSVAVTATSSTIGPIIPPSILFVVYGSMTRASVGGLFIGGVIPGIMMGLFLMLGTRILSQKYNYGSYSEFDLKNLIVATKKAILPLFMPFIIIGGIVFGIFTPTEAGVIAVVYGLIIGLFVLKELKISRIKDILVDSAVTTSMVIFILATSNAFGVILARNFFPQISVDLLTSLTESPYLVLLIMALFIILLGLFVETMAILVIFIPVLETVQMQFGIDPIHFGVVVVLAGMIGAVTPPVGILVYLCCSIADVSFVDVIPSVLPFVLLLIIVLFLLITFPSLVTFLPGLVF